MVVISPSGAAGALDGGKPGVVSVPVVPREMWVCLACGEKVSNSTSTLLSGSCIQGPERVS